MQFCKENSHLFSGRAGRLPGVGASGERKKCVQVRRPDLHAPIDTMDRAEGTVC